MALLDDLDEAFEYWLGSNYDLDSIHLALITAALVDLDGDLLWSLIVSGSGNAKTETVQSLSTSKGVHIRSTLSSEAGLLSGSPDREKGGTTTGGLLIEIGGAGVLVLKDVTSILSMPHKARDGVLAALREVYDGYWSRSVGANGGQTLEWSGRVAVVGAVTTAWDTHHAAVATFGDRFILLRTDSSNRIARHAAARQSVRNIGHESEMRCSLAAASKAVLDNVGSPARLTESETEDLRMLADLACRARGAVERDFKGEPLYPHALEMPTRLAKQLAQVVRGGTAIGMERTAAMRLAQRCALDSIPPLRLMLLRQLARHTQPATVAEIVKAVQHPRNTVDRELQCLQLLGLTAIRYEEYVNRRGEEKERWRYLLSDSASEDYARYLREVCMFSGEVEPTNTSQSHSRDFSGLSAGVQTEQEDYLKDVCGNPPGFPEDSDWFSQKKSAYERQQFEAAEPF